MAVSCHTQAEVAAAEKAGADFVVFGPVFGKKDAPEMRASGLELLRKGRGIHIPVFALGGVTAENAAMCTNAGAKGIAGIRLFQENNLAGTVAKLRG